MKRKNWVLNKEFNGDDLSQNDKEYLIINNKIEDLNKIEKKPFMTDIKLIKPKIQLNKEKLNETTYHSINHTNNEKKDSKIKEFGGNWDEVMTTSLKKTSLVQREKVIYREEVLKKIELDLKKRESKNEVFKFEVFGEEGFSEKKIKNNLVNDGKNKNNYNSVKKVANVLEEIENKSCSNCGFEVVKNENHKVFGCGHLLHNVNLIG